MTSFIVRGPFKVPVQHNKQGGRSIHKKEEVVFWDEIDDPSIADKRGCYVFGMREGKGTTVGYVGRTVDGNFGYETFGSHQREHYNQFLDNYQKGTPVLFFVLPDKSKGNARHIEDLEEFLIQAAVKVNPFHLQNIKGTKTDWSIQGILRSTPGGPRKAARTLKKMLDL